MSEEKDFIEERLAKTLSARNIQYSGITAMNIILQPKHIDYLADHVPTNKSIPLLDLQGDHLGDDAIPALKRLLQKLPDLKTLKIGFNNFTADGITSLKEELGRIETVELQNTPLGSKGGELLSELVASSSDLKFLVVADCNLGDEGVLALAETLKKNDSLYHINIAHNGASAETNQSVLNGILRVNQSLTRFTVDSNAIDGNEGLHAALEEMSSGNLAKLECVTPEDNPSTPIGSLTFSKISDNNEQASRYRSHVRGEWQKMTGFDLRNVERHHNAIFDPALSHMITERMTRYDAFVDALPKLPAAGEGFVDALFKPDANGFAALDNPKLFPKGNAGILLESTPLTQEVLRRRTSKESTVLEVAAHDMPAKDFMKSIHERGIKLGAAELLGEDGKLTPLSRTLIQKTQGASILFTRDNWLGCQPGEARSVFAALPAHMQSGVPINRLVEDMKAFNRTKGLGR